MAKKEKDKFLTQAEYARHRGVSKVTVFEYVELGKIPYVVKDGIKLIPMKAADEALKNNNGMSENISGESIERTIAKAAAKQASKLAVPTDKAAAPSYTASRAQRELLNVHLTKLELDERMGTLIPLQSVRVKWFETCRTVRNAFLALPDRVAPLVTGAKNPNDVHVIMTKEINSILENLSRGNV